MAKCAVCSSTILFGGIHENGALFCNDDCHAQGLYLSVSHEISDGAVQEAVWEVHRGTCPKCNGPGPIDIHPSHRVWSAVYLSSWRTTPNMSCRGCGVKAQVGDLFFSLALGWWGFPWGIFMTPIQVIRNIVSMSGGPDPSRPSVELFEMVRMNLAAQLLDQQEPQPNA